MGVFRLTPEACLHYQALPTGSFCQSRKLRMLVYHFRTEMKRQPDTTGAQPIGQRLPAWCRISLLLFLVVALRVAAAQTAQIKPTKRVLVFNEYGLSSPGVALILSEIRSSLYQQSGYKIDLFDESMETSLFPEESAQQEIRAGYIHKYRDKKPDIMVALGPAPIKFLVASRANFFPDVPIVFCGSTPEQAEHPKLNSHFTGAWMTIDPAKAIEVALRLQPGTKRVVVVGGVAPFDRGVESFVKAALRRYESRLTLEYLTDLDMPTLLGRLSHLPEHSIVLYTSLSTDAKGQSFLNASQSVPMVAQAANAPVYGLADTLVGQGIAGGFVSSYSAQGEVAASMIREILDGAKPTDIPVVIGTNAYMFDWRAMQRWGLEEKKLPIGSIVLYRQPGFWELYKIRIIGYALVLLASVLLTAYLLFERGRRKHAELSLQSSFEFEQLISDLSSYFIDLPADKIDAGIDEALNRLRVFLNVDRATMYEFSSEQRELLRTHCSSGTGTLGPEALNASLCPWYFANLLSGKSLFVKNLNELPAEATRDGKALEHFGVKSNAFVPMESERTVLGSLSWVTVTEERVWSDRMIHQLPTVGTIFANALLRKTADEARVSSELLKRAVLDSLSSGIAVLDGRGTIISSNPHWAKFAMNGGAGFTSEQGVGANYLETCRAAADAGNQSAAQALRGIEAVLAGDTAQFSMEWDRSGGSGPSYSLMAVTPLSNVRPGCVVTHTDITQRKQELQERLELSGQLIHAEEEERSRLARELHDDFNQRLAMLAVDLEHLSQTVADSPLDAEQRLRGLWSRAAELGDDLHSLSHQLHSSTLENLGLALGLSSLCHEFTEQQGIEVDFAYENVSRGMNSDVALCVFRIVQEALRNVKKHSGASRAEVRLRGEGEMLYLSVSDAGIGVDRQLKSSRRGLGIRSMEERLRLVGGRMDIVSGKNRGTTLMVCVPGKQVQDPGRMKHDEAAGLI
jgi:signal transduction histidine kinase/ABC-type uncharacterized transport system substrate-binding protein